MKGGHLALRGALPWKSPPCTDFGSFQAELPGAEGPTRGELSPHTPFKPYAWGLGNPDLTLRGQLLCLFRKAFITHWT